MRYKAVSFVFLFLMLGVPRPEAGAETAVEVVPAAGGTGHPAWKTLVVRVSSGGTVSSIDGNVLIFDSKRNDYSPLHIDEAIQVGDNILIEKGASVTVTFDNKTIYAVFPVDKVTQVTFRQRELPRL